MSNHRDNSNARSRDFGLRGSGAGKGDAPRHTVNETWRKNFDAINWSFKPVVPGKPSKVRR